MSAEKLSKDEIEQIVDSEEWIGDILRVLEKCKNFKEGDFLIEKTDYKGKMRYTIDAYSCIVKYKVIHVDKHGGPWIKKINLNGKLSKEMEGLVSRMLHDEYHYEIDPRYVDHVIMGNADAYDPLDESYDNRQTYRAISKYNKSIKINTRTYDDVKKFASNATVGDVFYTSSNGWFTIEQKKYLGKSIDGRKYALKIKDNKNKVKKITLHDLLDKAIYSNRPRSFNELKRA
jgi:hypothetical protein